MIKHMSVSTRMSRGRAHLVAGQSKAEQRLTEKGNQVVEQTEKLVSFLHKKNITSSEPIRPFRNYDSDGDPHKVVLNNATTDLKSIEYFPTKEARSDASMEIVPFSQSEDGLDSVESLKASQAGYSVEMHRNGPTTVIRQVDHDGVTTVMQNPGNAAMAILWEPAPKV